MSVRENSVASPVKLLDMIWFLPVRLGIFLVRLRCSALLMSCLVGGPSGFTAIRGHQFVKMWSHESVEADPCVWFPVIQRLLYLGLLVTAIKGSRARSSTSLRA